jgi:hypothetical protein
MPGSRHETDGLWETLGLGEHVDSLVTGIPRDGCAFTVSFAVSSIRHAVTFAATLIRGDAIAAVAVIAIVDDLSLVLVLVVLVMLVVERLVLEGMSQDVLLVVEGALRGRDAIVDVGGAHSPLPLLLLLLGIALAIRVVADNETHYAVRGHPQLARGIFVPRKPGVGGTQRDHLLWPCVPVQFVRVALAKLVLFPWP